MSFGIKLQTLRKDKRLSQEALAEKLNVSRQAVSKWERDEGYPETETIIMISNLFGVTLDYLMKENGENTISSLDENSVFLSTAELEDFMRFKKRFTFVIASSVTAIIVALAIITMFPNSPLAVAGMMVVVAIAVGSMILNGILSGKYSYLYDKKITLKNEDLEKMKKEQKKQKTTFAIMIAAGVFIIIVAMAVISYFYFGEDIDIRLINKNLFNFSVNATTTSANYAGGYLFLSVAVAVFMFIYASMIHYYYRQVCDTKEFVKEIQEEEEDEIYYAITMSVAGVIYFVLGTVFNLWDIAWVIFPVVAIGTYAFIEIKNLKAK